MPTKGESVASDNPYIASVSLVAFSWAMSGWALAKGSLLSIDQNTSLYALVGTTYGGNGTTTFALPNVPLPVLVNDQGADNGMSFQIALNGTFPDRS